MIEGVGRCRGPEGVHAETVHLGFDARGQPILADDVAIDRGGIERAVEPFGAAVVPDRSEQRTVLVIGVTGHQEIILDQPLRGRVGRHVADLGPLAVDPEMHHALAALQVLDPQPAQLLAPQTVVEQGRQDGAVAYAFQGVGRWRLEQLPGLTVAECRRAAFVAVGTRPFDPVDRVAGDRIALAQIVEQGRER